MSEILDIHLDTQLLFRHMLKNTVDIQLCVQTPGRYHSTLLNTQQISHNLSHYLAIYHGMCPDTQQTLKHSQTPIGILCICLDTHLDILSFDRCQYNCLDTQQTYIHTLRDIKTMSRQVCGHLTDIHMYFSMSGQASG